MGNRHHGRRLAAVFLAALLVAGMLCGCGSGAAAVLPAEIPVPAEQGAQEAPPASGTDAAAEPEAPHAAEEPAEVSAESPAGAGQTPPAEKLPETPGQTPTETPEPVEPQEAVITDTAMTCTFSISCAALLEHMEELAPEKAALVPADGWILPPRQVTFQAGESVFQVLQRVCREEKIHMEFEETPIYNSAYIEGIHNLYEFDCGSLSGWMYKVNGWFPNYGCSRYQLQEGDEVCFVYTCDLGEDVGGGFDGGGD